MSWKTINHILGLAAVDQRFWQELQHNPLAVLQAHGYELTPEEQAIFHTTITNDLSEFSRRLLAALALDQQSKQENHRLSASEREGANQ